VVSQARGEAFIPATSKAAAFQPIASVIRSIIVVTVSSGSGDANPFSMPHEIGHVTMDLDHALNANRQLMKSGTSGANAVDGTKRIRDGNVQFDDPGTFNPFARLRSEGGVLLEGW
jgi:hypothetical protein